MLKLHTRSGRRTPLRLLVSVVTFLFLCSTVHAESTQNLRTYPNIPDVISDVSDEELAEMRGRFIRQGRPVYFGISMQSQWSTAGGEIITAGMNVGINLRKDVATDNMVTIDVDLGDTGQAAEEITATPNSNLGGLDSTQGVAQAISVAGDDNQAHNKTYMTLRFISPELAEKAGGKVFYFGGKSLATSQKTTEITKTTSNVGQNGVVTTAFVDENGVGVKIEVPNQGAAMQLLRGKSGNREGSGFLQSIQLQGNSNRIINQLNFVAEFARTNNNVGNIRPALDSLKAIQGLGIQ